MPRAMYERAYGHRYEQADTVKAVAATIRREIRGDIKRAESDPAHPLHDIGRVSVRYRTASMMQAVDVTLTYQTHRIHRLSPDLWAGSPRLDTADGYIDQTLWTCSECGADRWRSPSAGQIEYQSARLDNLTLAALAFVGFHVGSFNHDGSETQVDYFDVRFYGSVDAKNPGDQWSNYQTVPATWARYLDVLADRAESGDIEADRIHDHDALTVLRAAVGR